MSYMLWPDEIITFIEEPKVIDRISAHLELTFETERHLFGLSKRNS
ncbi:MAG: hypothetical protein WBE11_12440 [Candidatus Aminicenantaceae bacterium]